MNRSCSCHCNAVGLCSCWGFRSESNSFSMLLPTSNQTSFDEPGVYHPITSSSSSVDCTLSLGTPSTRQPDDDKSNGHHRRSGSYLCWDMFQTKQSESSSPATTHKSSRGGSNGNNNLAGDPLLARRCANCDTTSTPLWRNGPRGPKSLCNACGIRYKKEERRATNNTSATAMDQQHLMMNHRHFSDPWAHHAQTQKMSSMSPSLGTEFRFMEEDNRDATTAIPFLSWRLNVQDRSSLVHDYI